MNTAITTTEKSSTLAARITEISERLRNPQGDEILAGLRWLMDSGMVYPSTIPKSKQADAYTAVLNSVPLCGLRKAFLKLRSGEYENINRAFIPLPAELAAMARAEARVEREDRIRLTEAMRTIEESAAPTRKVSEEGKARIRDLLANFRSETAERRKLDRGEVNMPATEEQVDRWSKIMALPDAPKVNADNLAFRRAVEAKVAESAA